MQHNGITTSSYLTMARFEDLPVEVIELISEAAARMAFDVAFPQFDLDGTCGSFVTMWDFHKTSRRRIMAIAGVCRTFRSIAIDTLRQLRAECMMEMADAMQQEKFFVINRHAKLNIMVYTDWIARAVWEHDEMMLEKINLPDVFRRAHSMVETRITMRKRVFTECAWTLKKMRAPLERKMPIG